MLSWKISLNCAVSPLCPRNVKFGGLLPWEAANTKPKDGAGGLQAWREGRLLAAAVWDFIQHLVCKPYLGSWGMVLQGKPGEGSWVRCFQDWPGRGVLVSRSACSSGLISSTDTCSASENWAFQHACWLLWDFDPLLYNSCNLWMCTAPAILSLSFHAFQWGSCATLNMHEVSWAGKGWA